MDIEVKVREKLALTFEASRADRLLTGKYARLTTLSARRPPPILLSIAEAWDRLYKGERERALIIAGKALLRQPLVDVDIVWIKGHLKPMIKGNIRKSGTKLYHVPGGKYYWETIMRYSEQKWFYTEEEAKAAGWTKCKS
ncbi:MAG: sunset domain-containing protein [Thermomicrobiales bacterium]